MTNEAEIGTKIRELRKEHLGFSQSELAEELDVSTDTVSRWERGQTEPNQLQRRFLAAIAVRDDVPDDFVHELSTNDGEAQKDSELLSSVLTGSVGAAAGGAVAGPLGALVGSLASHSGIFSGNDESDTEEAFSAPAKRLKKRIARSADNLGVTKEEFRDELFSVLEVASAADWNLETLIKGLYALSATSDNSSGEEESA